MPRLLPALDSAMHAVRFVKLGIETARPSSRRYWCSVMVVRSIVCVDGTVARTKRVCRRLWRVCGVPLGGGRCTGACRGCIAVIGSRNNNAPVRRRRKKSYESCWLLVVDSPGDPNSPRPAPGKPASSLTLLRKPWAKSRFPSMPALHAMQCRWSLIRSSNAQSYSAARWSNCGCGIPSRMTGRRGALHSVREPVLLQIPLDHGGSTANPGLDHEDRALPPSA